ncbi:MAG: O-acetyl-ADP-ribose deacetylase [Ideonella sp. MAG2]|nr:MAG: O-acetyl-ADP-ribose deacetylase [Ideonella sp. MAG2]
MLSITVFQGDITRLHVDAVVNAANSRLLGGGGVDGAIHRAAGPELLDACRALYSCQPGAAKITPGFRLPAAHVIHTVGPVWRGGSDGEPELLASCYAACLSLAELHQLKSIAFPCISTGSYGFPAEQAAEIAMATVTAWRGQWPSQVVFCCFTQKDTNIYQRILNEGKSHK